MAKLKSEVKESLTERPAARIRALLACTRPLTGNEVPDEYWSGRSLIEGLALAYETESKCAWSASECATVLRFLSSIEPTAGHCICNDDSDVNATCGLFIVYNFMADEVQRIGNDKSRKKAA